MAHSLPAKSPVWDTVQAPYRLTLGLRALAPDTSWLELDEDLHRDVLEKRAHLDWNRDQVFVELPTSRAAQGEALARVLGTLRRFHPTLIEHDGHRVRLEVTGEVFDPATDERPPLEIAAGCVQEDLVLMERSDEGWCLSAGVVCFPTRWDLPSKLGRPMTRIHERVPGYAKELDAPANRFFDGMKPGIVFRRGNWSLMDDVSLYQPTGKLEVEASPRLDASNAGQEIWLRVEHQTLQRLPKTDAILFGIRIHRTRLDQLAGEPSTASRLVEAIESMPAEMQRYKSLAVVRAAALDYLEAAIAEPRR